MWTIEANPGVDELLWVKLEGDPQESTKDKTLALTPTV